MKSSILHWAIYFVLAIGLIGCGPEAEIGYQPPIVPVRVSINTNGELKIGLSGQVVTSIGTFDIGGDVNVASLLDRYEQKVLIVRVDGEASVYELEEGKEFDVTFDDKNRLYRKVALKHEGNGDIVLELEREQITQTLQVVFEEIDSHFEKTLKSNIAFNKPGKMKKDETASIELILNPSLSESALATQMVERGAFVTSTAEPNILIAPSGETVTVTTSQIEITPRMKAVLLPQGPEAFTITEMHDNAEQVVSSVETTIWRWSVTAKKEGQQTLELIIYQLVKLDGKDYWHEVETYKADIEVEVTLVDRVRSLDWKWIAGFTITLGGASLGGWKWLDERKKKAEENKHPTSARRIK